jgi:uncharacterized membrane protein (UPF0182 family)
MSIGMRDYMKRYFLLLASVVYGAIITIPSAISLDLPSQQWKIILVLISCSFAFSFLCGFLWRIGDTKHAVVRIVGICIGAAICHSLIRQQVTLIIFNTLWVAPSSFLGDSLLRNFINRYTSLNALKKVTDIDEITGQQFEGETTFISPTGG